MKASVEETITVTIRLLAFGVTMVPFGALFLPWITIDGYFTTLSGVTMISLLVSPIRDFMFWVDPVQAAIITLGPVAIILLTIITGHRYYRRSSVPWAPPLMLATALAIIYFTMDLAREAHQGPGVVAAAAFLLTLHQAAIRLQVSMRRRAPFSRAAGILAIATGIAYRRRWR